MSFSAEQQNDTELDHIRDTLTGIVSFARKTRGEMHQRFDQQERQFSQFKHEVRERFDRQDKENAEIKEMLQASLSR